MISKVIATFSLCFLVIMPATSPKATIEPQEVPTIAVVAVQNDGTKTTVDRQQILAFKIGFGQLAEKERFRPLRALQLRRAANDEALCEYLAIKYADSIEAKMSAASAQALEGDGRLIIFLDWLIENQDAIISLIEKIMKLFASFEQIHGSYVHWDATVVERWAVVVRETAAVHFAA